MPTELLTDPGRTRQDMQLMEQAVKRSAKNPEIPIPEAVIEAMPKVVGAILLKGNQREQLRAASCLLAFMEYNKSLNPPEQQPQQTVVNVGVNVDNRTDAGRDPLLAIAERVKAAVVLRDSAGDGT